MAFSKSARRNLKVAFIVGDFPRTTENFVMNQIASLLDRNIDVKIFSLRELEPEKVPEIFKKYKLSQRTSYVNVPENKVSRVSQAIRILSKELFRRPSPLLNSLNFFKYGKPALTLNPFFFVNHFLNLDEKFDILHCHFGQRGIYGACLREAGVPGKLLTTFYGGDLSAFVKESGEGVYSELFKKGDLFLPLSEDFGRRLEKLGCAKNKIIVHPVGIDLDQFSLKKRRSSEGNVTQVLTIGRLVEKKGIEYSLRAMSILLKEGKKVEYTIVGDGPLMESLTGLAKSLRISESVKFVGQVSHGKTLGFLEKSDVFLLSSVTASDGDTEGTPVVLMEAQAMGLPIVSTNHAGIPEVVVEGKSGFLAQERDAAGLADRIRTLIDQPKLRNKMGKEGRRIIERKYNQKLLGDKLVGIYSSLP